jgi:tetratricopeptide (TPR) repeat protein
MSRQRTRTIDDDDRKEKRSPSDLFNAAFRHFQSARLGSAEDRCRRALALDPNHAASLHLLGLIHTQSGKLDTAIDLIAAAIKSNPNDAEYFSNLGVLLRHQNRFEEARKSHDLAIKLAPNSAKAWINLGDLLKAQGQYDESLLTYDHALTLDSTNTEAANKGGTLLLERDRFEEALVRFDRSQVILPDQIEVLRDSGICLSRLNRRDEAIAQFRKARQIKPDFVDAIHHLALTLHEMKRLEEALATFDRALSLSVDKVEFINNRGNVLMSLGRNEEALAHYERAIALKPDFAEAHANRGLVLDELFRMDEAAECYRKSIALKSDYPNAHWNLALNRLRVGDLKTGWAEAEWRWKTPKLPLNERNFECPLWLGAEPLRGKTILLHNDQGLGDALHFCRYVPMVAAMGANVILEVQKELCELLSGLAGVSKLVARGEALPDFDFHCPLCSLPLAFDTVLDTIPSATPYISVGNNADAWKNRLASVKSPRIGLVWSGNPTQSADRTRSMTLEALLPILETKASFISLQKEVRPADREVLDQQKKILDLGPELKSFADTAAVVSQLDLVITVDTSVAHLVGALGRPVWIMLCYVPCWRYLLHRTDSPWYPTARLFRQTETRDWRTVVREVRTELDSLISSLGDGADHSGVQADLLRV